MNKLFALLMVFSTIIPNDIILWDLGVSIKSNNHDNKNTIKPLISDTQIIPEYNKTDDILNFNIIKSNLSSNHIIKILYCTDRYAELAKYLDNIYGENKSLGDDHVVILSDALYRLGKYEEAINIMNIVSDIYPVDEKYFLLALYNKKSGNNAQASKYLNNLIVEHPDSEYYKLAKLQFKSLN